VGAVEATLPLHAPGVLRAEIPLLHAWTPARRLATVFPAACGLILAVWVARRAAGMAS
jgi:apolipoprotein N-acyltransferase